VRVFDTKRSLVPENVPRRAAKTLESRLGERYGYKLLILLYNLHMERSSFRW
jgi:hypothetical protein